MKWLLVFVACVVAAVAQQPRAILEQALRRLGMEWRDLVLPSDLAGSDRHRLAAVEDVFADPLAMIRRCEQLSRYADALKSTADLHVYDSLAALCGYSSTTPLRLDQRASWEFYPSIASDSALLRSSLVYQSIVQQYLAPIAAYRTATQQLRRFLRSSQLLFAKSDSLWLLSAEDEKADPYQLKEAELRGDSIAREYFDAALTPDLSSTIIGGLQLYTYLVELLQRTRSAQQLLRDSIRTIVWDTPIGRCAIGGPGDDVYRGDYAFILRCRRQ